MTRAALLAGLAGLAGIALALPRAGHAAPGPTQDEASLRQAVLQAAQALAPPGAQISLGSAAGARAMPACASPLTVSLSGVAPYEQAKVECPAAHWTLYVTVTVAQSEEVVVAARPIAAGTTLGAADLVRRALPVQAFAGRQIFTDPTEIEGDSAVMSIAAGMVITQDVLQTPLLVKAGQTVSVHVYSGGVELALDATADQPGHLGDTILLTNPKSGRRFSAEVTAQGVSLHLN
ncbi:flagellar basal body P-ring formation chaperone FlgA [Acidocella facilis]|uniref:flagellar basal body P-ring formation chaperone FlgA n=1 Tax=Acidocella facilis TaxID=525 RepID=UPI001F45B4E3|nr:flagellar basal body P-ring formation chaperone FlgA [Acidocella facilis]